VTTNNGDRIPLFSSDGCYVQVKLGWIGPRIIGQGESGGIWSFPDKIKAGFHVSVKGTHDTNPKVLTEVVRTAMLQVLGSLPVAMVPAQMSGLIEFHWEVSREDQFEVPTEEALLGSIESAVSNSRLRNPNSQAKESESELASERPPSGRAEWMENSLAAAKSVVKIHHRFCSCDTGSFFRGTTYALFVQTDRPNAYAYIALASGSRHFPIGVHPVLAEQTPWNQRALVVVLVHELLHAIHPEWGHDLIIPQEKLLANKAGYFDALVELQRIAVSGRMRFCGKGE
jgi:hypothetical protein